MLEKDTAAILREVKDEIGMLREHISKSVETKAEARDLVIINETLNTKSSMETVQAITDDFQNERRETDKRLTQLEAEIVQRVNNTEQISYTSRDELAEMKIKF